MLIKSPIDARLACPLVDYAALKSGCAACRSVLVCVENGATIHTDGTLPFFLSLHSHGEGRWLSALRLLASLTDQVDQILFWKVETTLRLRLRDDTIQYFR